MTIKSSSGSQSERGSDPPVNTGRSGPASGGRRKFLAFVAAAIVSGAGTFAWAQALILLVSRKRLLNETRQAKALREAEVRLSSQLQKKIDAIKRELSAEEEKLARERSQLDPEVFKSRVAAFDQRVRSERRRAQQYATNLRNAFAVERVKLAKAVGPVLSELRAAKNASLIIDADGVLAFDPQLDVTDEAIAHFNETVPMPEIPDLDTLAPARAEEN